MVQNPLLAAADTVRSVASAPKTQTGRMLPDFHGMVMPGLPGWDVHSVQHLIDVPELRWPRSIRTYEAMRREPQIQGLLTSAALPIRHMDWFVDPRDAPEQCALEIAEDLGLPLLGDPPVPDGVGIDFDDHLRLALLALAMGHQFFEEAGDIVGTGNQQKYRLRSLMQYPPSTILRINITSLGDLRSVQQHTVIGQPEVMADRLLTYVWDKEGANWAGRPLLYGLYWAWRAKFALLQGDVSTKQRFGGIPVVELTDPNVGAAAQAEAAKMAMLLQSGNGAGVAMPYGTRLHLLGVEGSIPDAIASARYHDEQMARAFMQMFAELGKTQSGSRALGTTLMDHYALGVLAVAKWVRKSLMVLVRRIVDRNYGPDVPAPTIGFRQDDHEDITINDLVAAIDSGLVTVDDDLEATIRDRANLPARNAAQPARPRPATTLTPGAPGGRSISAAADTAATAAPVVQAQTDFAALQAAFLTATARLKRQWKTVQAAQINDLVQQIERARTPQQLARIATGPMGADLLAGELAHVLDDGAQSALDEAAAQGATLPEPDLQAARAGVADSAAGTAELLARSLGESAASRAVALAGGGLQPGEIASQVRSHLESLSGATVDYELAGAVSRAQNEGRFTVLDRAPDGTRIYASELNDTHTCAFCNNEDGTEFPSMSEARRDYPAGGFVGCVGGNRCRGTLVAVYPEA